MYLVLCGKFSSMEQDTRAYVRNLSYEIRELKSGISNLRDRMMESMEFLHKESISGNGEENGNRKKNVDRKGIMSASLYYNNQPLFYKGEDGDFYELDNLELIFH